MQRAMKAANDAEALGELELAQQLRDDAASFHFAPKLTAMSVYGSIEDAVYSGVPPEAAVTGVANQISLTRDELLAKYRRAQTVAADAKERFTKWHGRA